MNNWFTSLCCNFAFAMDISQLAINDNKQYYCYCPKCGKKASAVSKEKDPILQGMQLDFRGNINKQKPTRPHLRLVK